MAEYRLSKLQKYILLMILENDYLTRREIYRDFWRLDIPEFKQMPDSRYRKIDGSKSVILSRSLRNLKEKDYIYIIEGDYYSVEEIRLTERGKVRARELKKSGVISSLFRTKT